MSLLVCCDKISEGVKKYKYLFLRNVLISGGLPEGFCEWIVVYLELCDLKNEPTNTHKKNGACKDIVEENVYTNIQN